MATYHEGSQSGPLSGYSINEIVYLDKNITKDYWDILMNQKADALKSMLVNLGPTAGLTWLTSALKLTGPEGFLLSAYYTIVSGYFPSARMQMLLDDVIEKSNYYENGIVLYCVQLQYPMGVEMQVLVKDSWEADI